MTDLDHLEDNQKSVPDSDCDNSYSEDFDSDSEMTTVTRRSSSSSSSSSSKFPSGVGTLDLELPDDGSNCNLQKNYSSLSRTSSERVRILPRFPQKNMSFTNMQVMQIERDNQCLLNKIMGNHKPISDNRNLGFANRLSSSAINRRKFQRKIQEENMMMLRKIQSAKPRVLTGTRKY